MSETTTSPSSLAWSTTSFNSRFSATTRRDLRRRRAQSFRRDAPHSIVEILDGGYFLLESHLDRFVDAIFASRANV